MPLRVLRPTDTACCRQIWRIIDTEGARIANTVQQAVGSMALAAPVELAVIELAGFGGGAAQRAALCSNDWAAYEDQLRARGTACAETGVELHAWFELIDVYQGALLDSPLAASAALRATVAQLRAFVMANIVQAYARARSALGQDLRGSNLFDELFHNTPTPTLIYGFDDRDDLGSFRLVVANAAAARITHSRLIVEVGRSLQQAAPERFGMKGALPSASWGFTTDSGPPANRSYVARCFPLVGNYLGVTLEDLTDRRRMENEMQRHLEELQRSNRELDDFAYAASHDLKSPLIDVKNLCGWIREDLGEDLPPDTLRHMGVILDRLRRMERLLDDLLAYSRAGRELAPIEQFTLHEMIDDVIALSPLPPAFSVSVQADVGVLRTPKAPLAQVIRNLIGNAVKHHDRDHGTVRLEAALAGDRILVSVADDGPGIPPEFHERVFRIFQTLRPRDEVEGSGVGLALAKKVVETHGGAISVASAGRGTTVRFSWPRESMK